jgi:hypothetical protein
MTTITPGRFSADRIAVEARPAVEDRFLLVALANVAAAIVFTGLALAYRLPAALGVDPNRMTVSEDAFGSGTALSAPVPLIMLLTAAVLVALQGGGGRKVATGICVGYGAVTAVAFVGEMVSATPLDGAALVGTSVLQGVGAVLSLALVVTGVRSFRTPV